MCKNRMLFKTLVFILLALVTTACEAGSDAKNVSSDNKSEDVVSENKVKDKSQVVVAETVTTTINYEEKFTAYLKDKNISLKSRDVLFDMQNTLNQPFAIMGKAELDIYYNYGFRDFEKTHFAVSIIDEGAGYSDRWVLYFDREEFNDLFQTLKKGGIFVIATGVILKAQYQDGQDELALGMDIAYEANSKSVSSEDNSSVIDVVKEYKEQKGLSLVAIDVLYDIQNHLDKPFLISGKASLDTYYNYGFRALEQSHFAIGVWDESTDEKWVVYFDRQEFSDVFDMMKQSDQYVTITAMIPSSQFEIGQDELAQGLDIMLGTGY
ncbi:hypothetical protein [Neobacillus vireti]|uniref:hypothetical protein n=1 Tax=Neobacillus vireti TaxID=220686 RepID=UPI00300064DE